MRAPLNNPNKKIGDYSFSSQNVLGIGSYSTVYLGQNDITTEPVAIKAINRQSINDAYMFDTLCSEIDVLKQLTHPNIVHMYDVLTTANNIYIVMEYCNGGTLEELLKQQHRLTETQAINVMKDLLCGFQEILRLNIVHRDIKPANVFISGTQFKIGDFGFAKKVENLDQQLMKSIVGTPLYMSPECLESKLYSSKNDVYSLGVIFFKLLFGRTPWPSRTRLELLKNMSLTPLLIPEQPGVSQESRSFLKKALEYRENERIAWNEIYDSPMFSPTAKSYIEEEWETSNDIDENTGNINPNNLQSKALTEKHLKHKSSMENSDEEEKQVPIYFHVKIIQKIENLIELLRDARDVSQEKCLKLSYLLALASQYHTRDLSRRLNTIKNHKSHNDELFNGIEEMVAELEHKNNEELLSLGKKMVKIEINNSCFEELAENLKCIIRENNHRMYEKKVNGTEETNKDDRKPLRFLKELLSVYHIISKFYSVKTEKEFSERLSVLEGNGEKLLVNDVKSDFISMRRQIYEMGI